MFSVPVSKIRSPSNAFRKVNIRVLLFLVVCYAFCFLDRINIGLAKLQMQSDLALSDSAYGLGAGIFFLGYMLFEVPSNLLLVRLGARRTLSRIMVLWGLASMSMSYVNSVPVFYGLRFLLGLCEAGFAPGIIFYLTLWYPEARIGRAMAILLSAVPIGALIGSPLSTWIMTSLAGWRGLAGWQWMFIVEGLPSIVLGVVAFFYLNDGPTDAGWLSREEKAFLSTELSAVPVKRYSSLSTVVTDPRTYTLAITYFSLICGIYAVGFWLPTILKTAGASNIMEIGLYSAVPYAAAIVGMYMLGCSSDHHRERRWHSALAAVFGAAALMVAAFFTSNFVVSLVGITLATALMYGAYTVFWAMVSDYLKGPAAAGGIALINSIGLFGGFLSPTIIAWTKATTGSLQAGLLVMVGFLIGGAVLLLLTSSQSTGRHSNDGAFIARDTTGAGYGYKGGSVESGN